MTFVQWTSKAPDKQWNLPEQLPLVSDHLTKILIGSSISQSAIAESYHKQPPPISDHLSLTSREVADGRMFQGNVFYHFFFQSATVQDLHLRAATTFSRRSKWVDCTHTHTQKYMYGDRKTGKSQHTLSHTYKLCILTSELQLPLIELSRHPCLVAPPCLINSAKQMKGMRKGKSKAWERKGEMHGRNKQEGWN